MALLPFNSDTLNSARGRARSALAQFTTGQKVMVGLAVVALVVGGTEFMHFESKPSYQPLFTNLQSSDSGAVTAQLTTAKIPYELSNGGATILVPAADVDQERVALAEQGLPSSGTVGFSNLEKSGITTSEFVQQVEYQQALEGQLEQTIESIQGVQSAQITVERKHLRAIDAVGIVASRFCAELEQALDPGFQIHPVATQKRERERRTHAAVRRVRARRPGSRDWSCPGSRHRRAMPPPSSATSRASPAHWQFAPAP